MRVLPPVPKGDRMLLQGDCIEVMKGMDEKSVQCCVTSPPYWGLRDYGVDGQIGLENSPGEFIANIVAVFREVHRVLKDDGTLWLNLGDSYYNYRPGGHERKQTIAKTNQDNPVAPAKRALKIDGLKEKDLVGIPWRCALALQEDGWYLRRDIIWFKPNPMPESVTDRPVTTHEYIFLLTKKPQYYYNCDAIREQCETDEDRPAGVVRDREYDYNSKQKVVTKKLTMEEYEARKVGSSHDHGNDGAQGMMQKKKEGYQVMTHPLGRNKRSVWKVPTQPYPGAHFATYPKKLIEPCILAGTRPGDIVLDPFNGSGTTGVVAYEHGREYIGIELNERYIKLSEERLRETLKQPNLFIKSPNASTISHLFPSVKPVAVGTE